MDGSKLIYLLLICQGFYLGSVCQWWTFPSRITVLIGSCMKIPCIYHLAWCSGASSMEYKVQTTLMPGNNSCTPRRDPERSDDYDEYSYEYYPRKKNNEGNRKLNDKKKNRQPKRPNLDVRDIMNVRLFVPKHITEGEATIIRCTVYHICGSSPPSLQWNKPGQIQKKSEDIYKGTWREESELTYIPSYADDGTPVQCSVTFPDGQKTETSITVNISYAAIGVHITVKKEHEFSELICDFLSSRPDVTHYTWRKDGSILHNETEKTLTIHSNEENYGQYSCIAHNRAGNSSSEEICIKREKLDLPLILGTVAGCLFLILLIVVIYFSVRQMHKSYFPAFRKNTPAARNPSNNTTAIDETLIEENQYGNIHSDRNAQPDSMRSIALMDVNFKDNYVIYSNSEVIQPTNEVEYSDICHVQHDHMASSGVDHGHNVEYATLRL